MVAADPRERLLALSTERGASLAALSALIGRNASYLQQFVRKGSPRKLKETDRRTLASFFGVPEAELGAPEPAPAPSPRTPSAPRPRGDWADIPRLDLSASAGPGALAEDERTAGQLRFSERWLRGQGLVPEQLTAIEVEGDSMEPTLRDGDEILVDRSRRTPRAGIHVIRLDGTLLVKRLEPLAEGRLRVISDNRAYAALERRAADVEVLGRVVWKGGRL